MYKHCNTEESAQRQRQLEQCLLTLMAELSYDSITISQICNLAGISRKSFYRYFDSKEGCLYAMLDHAIMDGSVYYLDSGENSDAAQLRFCQRIFEYWQTLSPLLDALEKNGMSLHLLQRMVHYILEEEPEYARYMRIRDQDVLEHAVYTVGGLMGMVLTWHHGHYQKSADQMGTILFDMIRR